MQLYQTFTIKISNNLNTNEALKNLNVSKTHHCNNSEIVIYFNQIGNESQIICGVPDNSNGISSHIFYNLFK